MDRFLSVVELAKAGNTTPRAVRLYTDKGLLEPMRIGRVHCFPENTAQSLKNILRAQRLGFSLDEIGACKNATDSAVLNGAIKRVEELMSDAEAEITDLRRRLAHVSKKEILP